MTSETLSNPLVKFPNKCRKWLQILSDLWLAQSWTGLTGAENLLTARRSWCLEEIF